MSMVMWKVILIMRVLQFFQWIKDIPHSNFTSDGNIKNIKDVKFGCILYESNNFGRYYDCDVILYHVRPRGLGAANENNIDRECKIYQQP